MPGAGQDRDSISAVKSHSPLAPRSRTLTGIFSRYCLFFDPRHNDLNWFVLETERAILLQVSDSQLHLDLAKRALDLHLDHHAGKRLPYVCISARGLHQKFVRLEGPAAGEELHAVDASGGYGSACLGAAHPDIINAMVHSLEHD